MPSTKRRYSKEELAQRGDSIYDRQVKPRMTSDDDGKIVAIDVDSGEFELDSDELAACTRLRSRIPNAQIWIARVGFSYVHRFG